MMEVAGVQVPVRLRQQLEQERQVQEEKMQRNASQVVEDDGPRLTHKLLRVCQLFEFSYYGLESKR